MTLSRTNTLFLFSAESSTCEKFAYALQSKVRPYANTRCRSALRIINPYIIVMNHNPKKKVHSHIVAVTNPTRMCDEWSTYIRTTRNEQHCNLKSVTGEAKKDDGFISGHCSSSWYLQLLCLFCDKFLWQVLVRAPFEDSFRHVSRLREIRLSYRLINLRIYILIDSSKTFQLPMNHF